MAIKLLCHGAENAAAVEVHKYMLAENLATENDFDEGYPVLNYRDLDKPRSQIVGAKNEAITCEEIWETALNTLDMLGEKAGWEEAVAHDMTDVQKSTIQKYQNFREVVEKKINAPVPWLFESPYILDVGEEREVLKIKAGEVRKKVRAAIGELNQLLAETKKNDKSRYNECLVVGLFWFTWMANKATKDTRIFKNADMETELGKYGELKKFISYLSKNGGLGLGTIDHDAPLERTALQTVIPGIGEEERELSPLFGRCTEQTKVLYAVFRMAGIKVKFVDPRLTIEYLLKKINKIDEPYPSHLAAGVAVTTGLGAEWVVDIALRMAKADYADENTADSEYPFWELSLRHYWMLDYAKKGKDIKNDMVRKKEVYENGLIFGIDSTAASIFGNYAVVIKDLKVQGKYLCETSESCTQAALQINPHDSQNQYNSGADYCRKQEWNKAIEAFIRSIDIDPRYFDPYEQSAVVVQALHPYDAKLSADIWKSFEDGMTKVWQNHPSLRWVIIENIKRIGLKEKVLDKRAFKLIKYLKAMKDTKSK